MNRLSIWRWLIDYRPQICSDIQRFPAGKKSNLTFEFYQNNFFSHLPSNLPRLSTWLDIIIFQSKVFAFVYFPSRKSRVFAAFVDLRRQFLVRCVYRFCPWDNIPVSVNQACHGCQIPTPQLFWLLETQQQDNFSQTAANFQKQISKQKREAGEMLTDSE